MTNNMKSLSNKIEALLVIMSFFVASLLFDWFLDSLSESISNSTSSVSSNADNSDVQVILDVPSLFGKSLQEIRAIHKVDSYEKLHPLYGYEDVLPSTTQSEGYISGKYSFWVFYNKSYEAVDFQLSDGLENHHLKVIDWNEISKLLNLNLTQSPDFINSHTARWENASGYHIEMNRSLSGDFVFGVIVIKIR